MDSSWLMLAAEASGSLSGHFTWIDWVVIFGYLALTTLIGSAMAGKQATIRDFFLGGRKLPWYAVSGSIIATEISAVTFVGVPAIVFAPAGNFTYLQLGLFGSILARIIVGFVFVRAYYQREIYSPYDYMAHQLGERARTVTTCLFILGGMLAQGARVFLTAMILELIIGSSTMGVWLTDHTPLSTMDWSIIIIGVIAIGWTLMGGITTVIWTDVVLFLVFLTGAIVALSAVVFELPGSAWESLIDLFRIGYAQKEAGPAGKLTFFNLSMSPTETFTLWTAIIASSWGGLAAYGTDQLLAQRMFCCQGPRQARLAIIASSAGQIITFLMLMVGLALFVYYREFPLTGQAAEWVKQDRDRVFPVFIIQVLPTGVTGLLIAGIFAAAISSLDSILAALSQTTISAFYLPWRRRRGAAIPDSGAQTEREDRRVVFISRLLVVFWGVMLCLMAYVAAAAKEKFPEILNLALSMAGYAGGALLAGFLLAFLRLRIDSRGFIWSAPLSVFTVFAVAWHQPWTHVVCWAGAAVMLFAWLWHLRAEAARGTGRSVLSAGNLLQTSALVAGLGLMLAINYWGYLDVQVNPKTGDLQYVTVAWPWFVPIGSTVAFVLGYLLAGRRRSEMESR
jgi:Na+/proline symporter